MIESIGQVMLYVDDPAAAKDFWCGQVGFTLIDTRNDIGAPSYVVAPAQASDVQFVLHDRGIVQRLEPEMNTLPPSILFRSGDIVRTHADMLEKGVQANEIQDMGDFYVFNFQDHEGQYFAVKQDKDARA